MLAIVAQPIPNPFPQGMGFSDRAVARALSSPPKIATSLDALRWSLRPRYIPLVLSLEDRMALGRERGITPPFPPRVRRLRIHGIGCFSVRSLGLFGKQVLPKPFLLH